MQRKELITVIIAFLAIYIVWGSTYMANKIIVSELPPFLLAGIRFCTAAIIVFTIAGLVGVPIKSTKSRIKNAAISGFFFITMGNGLAVWALQYIDSSLSAIIISAQPLVLLIMMRILHKTKIKPMSILGVGLGMLGMYILVSQRQIINGTDQWLGIIAMLCALVTWGYGSLFVSKAKLPKNQFVNGAYQMLIGGGLMILFSVIKGEDHSNLTQLSERALWAMAYLIVFGSIVAFTSFNYLLQRISPEKVATSTYVNPIVAMFCGWYFLDEIITTQSIVAVAVLFSGVYFINSVRFSRKGKIGKGIRKFS